jgi:hypothetical protein
MKVPPIRKTLKMVPQNNAYQKKNPKIHGNFILNFSTYSFVMPQYSQMRRIMKTKMLRLVCILFILLILFIVILLWKGILWIGDPSLSKYPVRGMGIVTGW